MKFVVFEMWGLERPPNVPKWIPWNSWCTKVLSSEGFANGQGWQCTTAQLDCLVGSFVKKWNSWCLRCEGWIGLQMSPNEYCKSPGARKFWIGWSVHLAKLVGAPRLDSLVPKFVKFKTLAKLNEILWGNFDKYYCYV